jgi:folylpolyglutamate synthase/dihydropteroate synthase
MRRSRQTRFYRTETVEKALEIAKEISAVDDLICITGSLYLVGEAQKLLIEMP